MTHAACDKQFVIIFLIHFKTYFFDQVSSESIIALKTVHWKINQQNKCTVRYTPFLTNEKQF